MNRHFTAFLLLCCAQISFAQQSHNFDFEQPAKDAGEPSRGWRAFYQTFASGRNLMRTDSTVFFSGAHSLLIEKDSVMDIGVSEYVIPVDFKGKEVVLQGYIRTENVQQGYAGLWMRIDGSGQFDNMYGRGSTGTTDWKLYTIKLKLDENADAIHLGGLLSGTGKMWMDKLMLTVDGNDAALVPKLDPSAYSLPAASQQWLKANAIPLTSVDAGQGTQDLQPLKKIIGDARIVSLGECTHGTSEIFRMKHRMLEFLATEMGFTIFSIEANMPETYAVNDYVLRGIGDPHRMLDTMYFWTWNTQEVMDMMVWMRQYNLKHPDKMLQFTGFDMQNYKGAAQHLQRFAQQYAPDMQPLADTLTGFCKSLMKLGYERSTKKDLQPLYSMVEDIRKYIRKHKAELLGKMQPPDLEWTLQNITVIEQFGDLMCAGRTSNQVRDRSMADNVKWIMDHNPGAKMVVWAHNGHVNRTLFSMGSYLDRMYGKEIVVFGFGAAEGTYTAVVKGKGVTSNNVLEAPARRSLEGYGRDAGLRDFVLDVRKQTLTDPAARWLLGKVRLRNLGAVAMDGSMQFETAILPDRYDAIICLDKTRASACFKTRK